MAKATDRLFKDYVQASNLSLNYYFKCDSLIDNRLVYRNIKKIVIVASFP